MKDIIEITPQPAAINTFADLLKEAEIPTTPQAPQKLPENEATPEVTAQAPVVETPQEPKATPEMLHSTTNMVMAMADFGQSSLFRVIVNKKKKGRVIKLYGEGAAERLERVVNEEKPKDDLTTEEKGLLKVEKEAQKIIDKLALTKDEKEQLYEPLKEYLTAHNATLPPSFMIWFTVAQILGSRAISVIAM